ncbi:MAG: type II secretion system minor pseudopilin GspI [Pseudomonadota bacterium]
MHQHRPRRRPRARGFTLLEVLVALAIVGTALVACIRAVGSLTQNNGAMRAITFATWSAENRFIRLRVAGEFPVVGKNEYDCSQGELFLMCEEQVTATGNRGFRRVEIAVYDGRERSRRIVKLVQVVPSAL